MTKIYVEDYGHSLGEAIQEISEAVKDLPVVHRAIALLLKDRTSLTLRECIEVLNALESLDDYYSKATK